MGTISIIYFRRSLFVFASVCVTDDFTIKKRNTYWPTQLHQVWCACARTWGNKPTPLPDLLAGYT